MSARSPSRAPASRTPLVTRQGDTRPLGQEPHGLGELETVVTAEELEGVASGVAAEAVKEVQLRVDREGGRLFLVKRAEALPALAGALERNDRPHEVHEIDARADLVEDLGGHSHRLALRAGRGAAASGEPGSGPRVIEHRHGDPRAAGGRLREPEAPDQRMSAKAVLHGAPQRARPLPVDHPDLAMARERGVVEELLDSRPRLVGREAEEVDLPRRVLPDGSDTDVAGGDRGSAAGRLDLAPGDPHRQPAGLHGDLAVGLADHPSAESQATEPNLPARRRLVTRRRDRLERRLRRRAAGGRLPGPRAVGGSRRPFRRSSS